MPAERPIFSSYPRKVEKIAIPAFNPTTNTYAEEEGGQLYFLDKDSLFEFPEIWRVPNAQIPFIKPQERPYLTDRQNRLNKKYKQLDISSYPPLSWPEEDLTDGRGWHYPGEKQPSRRNQIHWPEEDPLEGRGYYYPHLNEVPIHYIERNKVFWKRRTLRGFVSKPMELRHTRNFLHNMFMDVFPFTDSAPSFSDKPPKPKLRWPEEDPKEGRGWSYPIIEEKPSIRVVKPDLYFSTAFDRPKSPSAEFNYFNVKPSHIPEEDQEAWLIGMGRITEYGTNYFMSEAIKKKMDLSKLRKIAPVLRGIAEVYTTFSDFITYRFVIGGTYIRMGEVEHQAMLNGKNYNDSEEEKLIVSEKAVFEKEYAAINGLISDTKDYSGCSDIDDMAMEIGYNRFKVDIGKLVNKLEPNQKDGNIKAGFKNGVLSVLAGGVFRIPGLTELSAGGFSLLLSEPIIVNLLALGLRPELIPYFTSINNAVDFIRGLALLIANGIWGLALAYPYLGGHELLHNYSANRRGMGLIPGVIKRFVTTPGFVNLETEPKSKS